ncbi:MAG: type I phosphomannose isomerase catalytic subunit, partial [Angelakisella sp.]
MAMIQLTGATKDYLWGGRRLIEEFGKTADTAVLAESWELSCHPDGESTVATGSQAGVPLTQWLKQQPGEPLGVNCRRFDGQLPILIKLIDAASPLSIQVHPSDEYAHLHEGQNGKTEVWYIVD